MTDEMKKMLACCDGATQGEWENGGNCIEVKDTYEAVITVLDAYGSCSLDIAEGDKQFIATFNPIKVRELLERLRRAEEFIEDVEALNFSRSGDKLVLEIRDRARALNQNDKPAEGEGL